MKILLVAVASCAASCTQPSPEVIVPDNPVPPESKLEETPVRSVEKGKSTRIGLDDFYPIQQSGEVLIYDVRDAYFYKIDHIPGARNWPSKKYEEQIRQRDIEIRKARNDGRPVVLYCSNLGCPDARNVAKKLARRGYNVAVLNMGIDSWRNAGLPLDTPEPPEAGGQ